MFLFRVQAGVQLLESKEARRCHRCVSQGESVVKLQGLNYSGKASLTSVFLGVFLGAGCSSELPKNKEGHPGQSTGCS